MILPVKGATVSSRTCIRLRTLGLKELLMLKISFRIYLMIRAKQIFRCKFIVLKSRLREQTKYLIFCVNFIWQFWVFVC